MSRPANLIARAFLVATIIGASLWVGACAQKTIGHVLTDPARYAHRTVTLNGHVVQSYSALGRGAYQLRDRTGTLWVVSDQGVPRQGTRVRVTGSVRDVFDAGSLIPVSAGVGLVMQESSRKASY